MSSVFFKFKSQKESQRVTFDGTGITVFELKREIINISRLGDGTDFDLNIYNADTNEEYGDDTIIIPRSTSVVARRLPAAKHGQGRAARYVSGRMPVNAKNNYRKEQTSTPISAPIKAPSTTNMNAVNNAKTEEERMKALLDMGGAQWEQQQQHMSTATRVSLPGFKNKNIAVPDHPPPAGYVCYRCGQKGHWIQVCPTNDNPEFENKPRIKRITGIPKSFLKTVEDVPQKQQDGLTDDARQPTSIMVNAEGDRVVAVPDMAAWDRYQEKAKASAVDKETVNQGSKELRDRGLECPIDKQLFVDPMKTPCCGTTYCNECIDNALINSDLVCPNCSTEGVLMDNLVPDEGMNKKIREYEDEKKAEKKAAEKPHSPKQASDLNKLERPTTRSPTPGTRTSTPSGKRKRSVDDNGNKNEKPPGPAEMKKPSSRSSKSPNPEVSKAPPSAMSDLDFIQHMNAMAGMPNGTNPLMSNPFANTGATSNPFNPMSMSPMLGMPNAMMNPMMMMPNQFGNAMPGTSGMTNFDMGYGAMGGFPQQGWQQGLNGNMNGNMGMNANANLLNGMNGNMNGGWNSNMGGVRSQGTQGRFNSQQMNSNQSEEAYMRKPVNPNRQQGRQRRARPMDYKQL